MRNLIAPALLALAFATPAAAETRAVGDFDSVSASAGVQVQITTGAAASVDVTGPDAAEIITEVSNGRLNVHPRQHTGWRMHRRNAIVRVTMPRVEALEASSGAHIIANGLRAGDLALAASSGAGVVATGVCTTINADASSGARVNAGALQCQSGAVEASSGARADVNVTGRLDVDASSGGDVYASGSPQVGDISLSSGGSLHRS